MVAKTFRDIKAWQVAYQFVLKVYQATVKFPPVETYGLTSQLRRAAVSITLNIAEGFKRQTVPDRLHFYNMAQASLEETKCASLLAKDLGYLDAPTFAVLWGSAEESSRLLHGWMSALRQKKG